MKKHTLWILLVGFAFLMGTASPVLAQGKVDINKAKKKGKDMMKMNPCAAKAKAKEMVNPCNPCAAKAKAKKTKAK